jgi:hypothetical protein
MIDLPLWADILIKIACGFTTSVVFLIVIFLFFRPKIKISPEICKKNKDANEYFIKIINRSCFFKIIDVNAELVLLSPVASPGGTNLKIERLTIPFDHVWYLSHRDFNKNNHATYAYIFKITSPIEELWDINPGSYLHFKIVSKHGFSGFPKVKTMHFHHKETSIKIGAFAFGNNLSIIT